MESYIPISAINDFLYSPRSLYLHSVYSSFSKDEYHESPQTVGTLTHQNIAEGTYSTAKRYLQGMSVYSSKYNIGGKIDIYDCNTKSLIERKAKIKRIYEGQKYQLFAQMFALQETGYEVRHLFLHSLSDNKRYGVPLPTNDEVRRFEKTLADIRSYDPAGPDAAQERCDVSIYRHLSY